MAHLIKFITHPKEEITEKLRGMLNPGLRSNSPGAGSTRKLVPSESVVMSEINKCRTHVEFAKLSRIHKDTHDGEFPLALMKLCASREIKEDNMTVFVDYMDKLLPRANHCSLPMLRDR
jgi:hypothetical protein